MQVLSYLGLGSNLGNRRANLKKAVKLLEMQEGVKLIKSSPVYETSPVGGVKQNYFYNAVVKVSTILSPTELLEVCKGIEKKLKRKKTMKWGPRTLDVDILLYGAIKLKSRKLTVPHKEMLKREFVLRPLIDIIGKGKSRYVPALGKIKGKYSIGKKWTKV